MSRRQPVSFSRSILLHDDRRYHARAIGEYVSRMIEQLFLIAVTYGINLVTIKRGRARFLLRLRHERRRETRRIRREKNESFRARGAPLPEPRRERIPTPSFVLTTLKLAHAVVMNTKAQSIDRCWCASPFHRQCRTVMRPR